MAKSTKFSSKVPELAEYKFTFVNEDGEIADVEAAKKAFHTLMVDKAKAQDARDDALAENAKTVQERDELQEKVDDRNAPDAQAEIAKAKSAASKAEADAKAATARADRLQVAIDKGLSTAQAKRLQGENLEELEADADEILELFGGKATSGDEEEEEGDQTGRTTPQLKRLTNGGDPVQTANAEPDYEKIAGQIAGGRVF